MSAQFRLCLYLLFSQRLLRGLFIFGACLVLPGILWSLLNSHSSGGLVLMSVGTGIALLFPVLLMPLTFRQLISGRHLAMVPNLRRLAGASLLLLCILITLWLALLLMLGQHANPIAMAIFLFSTISGYWLFAQWLQQYKVGSVAIWILIVAFAQVPSNKALVTWAMTTTISATLLVITLLSWLAFAWWLRRARLIHNPIDIITLLQSPELRQQQHQTWLDGKLSFSGIRSASGSVLRGTCDNWRNRLLLHFLAFFLFPVLLNVAFVVLDVIHGSKQLRTGLATDTWLTMGAFGSTMVSFYSREWLARTRMLWLRSGGDRLQIWQKVLRMTQQDTVIALLVSSLYFSLVAKFTDLSYLLAGATALLCTSAVWLSVNAGHFARMRGWSWVSAIALMMLMMLLLCVTLVEAQRRPNFWLPVYVATFFFILGSLVAQACKRHVVQVDWCLLRPVANRMPVAALR